MFVISYCSWMDGTDQDLHVVGHCMPPVVTGAAWEAGVTHVLAPSLKRSDKTVCAMAAGNWLLDSTRCVAWLSGCAANTQLGSALWCCVRACVVIARCGLSIVRHCVSGRLYGDGDGHW